MTERYWLTPPDLAELVKAEIGDKWFDPCPYPRPAGYNGLELDWESPAYVNPPFRKHDGVDGQGPTAFVHKAIEENKKGVTVCLALPTQSYVNLLLEAGATLKSAGRPRWLEADTLEPSKSPSPITLFTLRPPAADAGELLRKLRAERDELDAAIRGLTLVLRNQKGGKEPPSCAF